MWWDSRFSGVLTLQDSLRLWDVYLARASLDGDVFGLHVYVCCAGTITVNLLVLALLQDALLDGEVQESLLLNLPKLDMDKASFPL